VEAIIPTPNFNPLENFLFIRISLRRNTKFRA